jgi:hypothetical protein
MKVKSGVALLLFFPLLISQSGCTAILWSDEDFPGDREPAPDPKLRLYQATNQNDFLVVYREQSESNERTHTRAYWLIKNQIRITRNEPPIFASQHASRNLNVIPVYNSLPPNAKTNKNLYAVYGTNSKTFAIFSTNREVGSYPLPAYDKGRPLAEKIALTPLAMTVDAALAAAIIGLVILCAQNS